MRPVGREMNQIAVKGERRYAIGYLFSGFRRGVLDCLPQLLQDNLHVRRIAAYERIDAF